MSRRFAFVGGSSAKFWEINVAESQVVVRFGRLGADGQRQTRSFADPVAAGKHAEKLIGEKLAKGYVECAAAR